MGAWLVFVCGLLLVMPKINIIQINGQTSGIRLDDLFLLGICPYLIMRARDAMGAVQAMRLYLIFIGMAILSALWNLDTNSWKLMLYPLRLLEYTTFLILGALCTNRNALSMIACLVIILNTIAAVGQMFLDFGGFPYSRYAQDVGARAIGLTAGPWEMAAVVNIALAYLALAWGKRSSQITGFLSVYFVALVCLILSGSRVGIVMNIVIAIIYFVPLEIKYSRKILGLSGILLISLFAYLALPNSLSERSRAVSEKGNLESTQQILNKSDCVSGTAGEIVDFAVVDNGKQDPSWGVRAQKWAKAICVYRSDVGNYFLGVGPGYFGPALDGGLVRLLVEHGIIGLLLLLVSLFGGDVAFRKNRLLAIVFAAHMVFIDIYLSYKFVSLLFFIMGTMYANHNNMNRKAHDPIN